MTLVLDDLPPGVTIHYRLVTVNTGGTTYGSDQTLTTPAFFAPGDANGDGVVDLDEVNAVLAASDTHGLALSIPALEQDEISGNFALTPWRSTLQRSDAALDPPDQLHRRRHQPHRGNLP